MAYLLTVCELVATTIAYSRLYAGDDKIDDAPLLTALAVLVPVGTWAVALGTFLLSINRTHLNTFVSTETGPEFTRCRFDHFAGNNEQRMEIFGVHASMWAPFADVVRAWLAQRYATISVQPWCTPEMKARIPSAGDILRKLHRRVLLSPSVAPVSGRIGLGLWIWAVAKPAARVGMRLLASVGQK